MSVYSPLSTYSVIESNDGDHPRIRIRRGQVIFECSTILIPNTHTDGNWRRLNDDGSLGGKCSDQTVRELDKALKAYREEP